MATPAPAKIALAAVWYLAVVTIAFVAIGVELDRQSRFNPWLATKVPDPFRADALAALTKLAFERNESYEGEAFAQKLVERRPIPAEALSLYAEGLLANGKNEAGASVLEVAAGRGWRDRFVQQVVILSALQQDNPKIAAQRVIGLWRIGERSEWLKELTQTTLETPGGLLAFETALIPHDGYFGTEFLVWAVGQLPLAMVDRLAGRFAANRSEFDCVNFSDKADRLVGDGKGQSAMAVWNALCSPAHRSSMNDLRFEAEDALPGPFDWRYPENPGVDAEVRHEQGGGVLHYTSSDPLARVIARRYLTLGPGRYVLKINKSVASSAPKLDVACVTGIQSEPEISLEAGVGGQWSFVVPSACRVQNLSIAVGSGLGDIGRMEMSRYPD